MFGVRARRMSATPVRRRRRRCCRVSLCLLLAQHMLSPSTLTSTETASLPVMPTVTTASSMLSSITNETRITLSRRYILPPCYKMNFEPGTSYNTPVFFSPQRPWQKFSVRVFPRGENRSQRRNVSVFIEFKRPDWLSPTARLRTHVTLNLIGQAPNTKAVNYGTIGTVSGMIDKSNLRIGWSCLMTRDHLFDRYRDVLKRGRFQLSINMSYDITGLEYAIPKNIQQNPDCYIVCGIVRIPVHLEVLRCQTPNINRFLKKSESIPEINFTNVLPTTIHEALMYFYFNEVPSTNGLRSLSTFAGDYGFHQLQEYVNILLDEYTLR